MESVSSRYIFKRIGLIGIRILINGYLAVAGTLLALFDFSQKPGKSRTIQTLKIREPP